jgi:hypothetical protein
MSFLHVLMNITSLVCNAILSCMFIGVPLHEQDMVTERLMQEYSCVPVFLDDDLVDKYYNGFR